MLPGNKVDLRIMEKEDLPLMHKWSNDIEFNGQFEPFTQESLSDVQKQYENLKENQWFLIQRKDGVPIGYIAHFKIHGWKGIGYMLVPEERGKGYGSEAVQIMVDYLFLHFSIIRIEAQTHKENKASHRVLEKAGFVREGTMRNVFFSRGVWRDTALFSLLRDDWQEPRVLPVGYRPS